MSQTKALPRIHTGVDTWRRAPTSDRLEAELRSNTTAEVRFEGIRQPHDGVVEPDLSTPGTGLALRFDALPEYRVV